MKLVTAQQMQALDRASIDTHGIPSLSLMERAGAAVADVAVDYASRRRGSVVVVCGRGNNGGDGLVAARLLIQRGLDVTIFLMARSSELSPDARANWERLVPLTAHVFELSHPDEIQLHHPTLAGASVIIDALLGTGLEREVTGSLAQLIEYLNVLKQPIVSVDMPSGLSADTGRPLGVAIRAAKTVTLGLPKVGLYTGNAADYAGEIIVADIGIPPEEVERLTAQLHVTDHATVRPLLPPRARTSHKGEYGHVAVVAGSGGKLGAGYLACMAAFRVGAGLVTYYLPEKAFEKFDARYPEIMCEALPDRGRGHFHADGLKQLLTGLEKKIVVALGPAMGIHPETKAFVRGLISSSNIPMVIDADGINNLDAAQVTRRAEPTVLTPHPGEFGKLTGIDTDRVQRERLSLARDYAAEHRVILVLKGYHTVVAEPSGTAHINTTGGPAMASAGMGDALTGAIAGLIAQGIDAGAAAVAGAYLHGLAGDEAARDIGDRGIVASDVIR
jgi:NAD(P)H-hydrate epimerase